MDTMRGMWRPLTSDLAQEDMRPYFLWDEDTSIRELRTMLASGDRERRIRYIAKIMREARDDDVWRFLSLGEVLDLWPELGPMLGRSRGFWEFMLDGWRRQKLIA